MCVRLQKIFKHIGPNNVCRWHQLIFYTQRYLFQIVELILHRKLYVSNSKPRVRKQTMVYFKKTFTKYKKKTKIFLFS